MDVPITRHDATPRGDARTTSHADATIMLFYAEHSDFGIDDYYLTTCDIEMTDAGMVKDDTGIRARRHHRPA